MMGKGLGNRLHNRRKIFSDSSRNLSISDETLINFPVCEMDLLFWKNIQDLGDEVE